MGDQHSDKSESLTSPANNAAAITPHDTNELPTHTRGIFVGVGGNVVAILNGDTSAVTFKNVPSGAVLPVRAKVVTTASTATDMVALY